MNLNAEALKLLVGASHMEVVDLNHMTFKTSDKFHNRSAVVLLFSPQGYTTYASDQSSSSRVKILSQCIPMFMDGP